MLRILSMPLHQLTWYGWFETFTGVALMAVPALPTAGHMSAVEVGIVYWTVPR
jgi:hypothetical protein